METKIIELYKEMKDMKKDIEFLKNKYEPLKKMYKDDVFDNFCNNHIEEKPSTYGNLKLGLVTDLFKQWHSIEYKKSAPKPRCFREYMEQKYGKYPKGGWTNLSIKE